MHGDALTGDHARRRAASSGTGARIAALVLGLMILLGLPAEANAETTLTFPLTGNTGDRPLGIALDSDGNVYTANQGANTISRILASGDLYGSSNWINVGSGANFVRGGILFDSSGNIFVVGSNAVVVKYSPAGALAASPWPATVGSNPAPSIATDSAGNLYVATQGGGGAGPGVSKITPGGQSPVGWPVTVGSSPDAITLDSVGNVYTANSGNGSDPGTVSRITPSGVPDFSFGSTGVQPSGITTDPDRNIYTVNCGSSSAGSVSRITAAGTSTATWASLGAGTCPRAITIDSAGNLYTANNVSDSISRVTPTGAVTSLATTSDQPIAITIDSEGNLYTANEGDDNVTKVIPAPEDGVAPAPPDIPVSPSAVAGSGSATVTVTANTASARFGTPTSYSVEAVQDPTKRCTVTPPAMSCVVAGLNGGSSYTFTARSNLNVWQTGASSPSNEVKPRAHTVTVGALKAKVSKKSVSLSSKVTVSGAGKIDQTAKAGKKTWCKASKTISAAGAHTLNCELGKKARSAIRRKSLKLSVKTTFTPTAGSAVSKTSKVTIKRKR